jgi:hypothetical protein
MKIWSISSLLLLSALFAGCEQTVRSISHSGYEEPGPHYGRPAVNTGSDPVYQYRGELSEFDVLGIARGEVASKAEIRRALDNSKRVKLHRGNSLMLIQSGAVFPDGPMVVELSKHFGVVPFTGVPSLRKANYTVETESLDPESYASSLRLAAARGGADVIVCYWGILESEIENLGTKTVSWVPLANWLVPDERQHLRLRLKLALIDVRSGNWTVFSPKAFDDSRISTSPRREVADQKQVERLKAQAYANSARELVRLYSDVPQTE